MIYLIYSKYCLFQGRHVIDSIFPCCCWEEYLYSNAFSLVSFVHAKECNRTDIANID